MKKDFQEVAISITIYTEEDVIQTSGPSKIMRLNISDVWDDVSGYVR